jgi:hypothetical protein
MITETKQLITCFISTKNEILRDHGASRAWGPREPVHGPHAPLR